MSRSANLSPLGLYQWDQTIFDLLQIPAGMDRDTLIDNLLAETAELEVLYPNPVVFKNLVGVWSNKEVDIWTRLLATTNYEYNPIENYDRSETGTTGGSGSTQHSGSDTTTESTTYGGSDGRTESIMHGGTDTITHQLAEGGTQGEQKTGQLASGGTDTLTKQYAEGGTQGEQTTGQIAAGGTDTVNGTDSKGHWIAGFNSAASGQSDGLVKQTRDEDTASTTTNYGKTESSNGSTTTSFGKTESGSDTTAYGKTESTSGSSTTTFGKTESGSDATAYGKTENLTESRTYGQTIGKMGGITHGEKVVTSNEGTHSLRAHGNIGVTTTQEMIWQQRKVEKFNVYDIIIEDFKMRFCILIY